MKELGFSEVSADRLRESGALHKGALRIGGCVIGGALALFTIVFLMPHMDTIASLIVVVACASAIAGWVATGTELISYAGLQIAFAFFYSVFEGYAPDTDLDNVRIGRSNHWRRDIVRGHMADTANPSPSSGDPLTN